MNLIKGTTKSNSPWRNCTPLWAQLCWSYRGGCCALILEQLIQNMKAYSSAILPARFTPNHVPPAVISRPDKMLPEAFPVSFSKL